MYGSDSTTDFPVSLFTTVRDAISLCVCPTRIASIPGTCSATSDDAFSGYGNASPYDVLPSRPE